MQASERPQNIIQFGAFEVDAFTGELRKRGVKVKLRDQPFQILLLLLERPGELVVREEIQKRLWPENTFVDFDNAINSSIRKLREALGDSSENPRFIETLARRGYRFITPVSYASATPQREAQSHRPSRLVEMPAISSRSAKRRYILWTASAFATLLAAMATVLLWRGSRASFSRPEALEPAVPLTGDRGREAFPTFSPDGTRVAFAWKRLGEQVPNIYVKLVGPGEAVRLTTNPAGDFAPAWSPDGLWIAFLRMRQDSSVAVMIIPALGGGEREITDVPLRTETLLHYWQVKSVPSPFLAWSSDERWLLTLQQNTEFGAFSIVRVSVETGQKRVLTFPSNETAGDGGLSISRDGKTLVFARSLGSFEDIFVGSLSEDFLLKGAPTRLTFDQKEIDSVAWTPDGHSLVFSSDRGGRPELWQMGVLPRSEPVRVAAAGEEPRDVAVSRQGNYLVYAHGSMDYHIWRMLLDGGRQEQPQLFISSSRMEHLPQYSPDGRRIAFQSGRSGSQNIWICNADGSHPFQLTSVRDAWAGSPRWSPNGQKIAFDSDVSGKWHIYVIDAQFGRAVQLTKTNTQEFRPTWSHDGKWIYFCSPQTGRLEIWKVPAAGGTEVPVTRNGGRVAFESADGEDLYYTKEQQLWKEPTRGGNETLVLPSMLDNNYAPVKHGIYFLQGGASDATLRLQFLDFATHAIRNIGSVRGPSADEIAVSPDEHWFLYATFGNPDSELMLIRHFL